MYYLEQQSKVLRLSKIFQYAYFFDRKIAQATFAEEQYQMDGIQYQENYWGFCFCKSCMKYKTKEYHDKERRVYRRDLQKWHKICREHPIFTKLSTKEIVKIGYCYSGMKSSINEFYYPEERYNNKESYKLMGKTITTPQYLAILTEFLQLPNKKLSFIANSVQSYQLHKGEFLYKEPLSNLYIATSNGLVPTNPVKEIKFNEAELLYAKYATELGNPRIAGNLVDIIKDFRYLLDKLAKYDYSCDVPLIQQLLQMIPPQPTNCQTKEEAKLKLNLLHECYSRRHFGKLSSIQAKYRKNYRQDPSDKDYLIQITQNLP